MIERVVLKRRFIRKISRYRGGFFLPLVAFMFFSRWNEYENDPVIWAAGSFLLLSSLLIRVWATAHIGARIPKRLRKGLGKRLVTTGPYRMVRNPLYIANIIAMLGLCTLFELPWLLPFTFLYLFALYSMVVRYEEERLSKTLGVSYVAYKKQVPRWIPKINGFRHETGRIPWGPVISGESRSCILGISVLALAMLKELFF